jgi:hypothetical protein
LCTVAGLYRYAVEEGLLAHSPAVHVRHRAGRRRGGPVAAVSAPIHRPPY